MELAAPRGLPHRRRETFFHPEGERGPTRRERDEAAQAVCLTCPVLQRCREHALRVREPYGVWGAMTEDERTAYLATRPNGIAAASWAVAHDRHALTGTH